MICADLEKAKMLLCKTDYTCVLCRGDIILTDKRRGVRPLLELLNNQAQVQDFSVADKVVGKAAAYLYCLLGIRCIFALVISRPALAVLQDAGIGVEYDRLVDMIQNRAGDGRCPMESAVLELHDPHAARKAIEDTLKKL